MQPDRHSGRVVAALAAVAVLSLYGSLDFYSRQVDLNKAQKDAYNIGAQEQRFAAVKRELGSNAVAGYVSDLSDPGILLSAQYALAPVLLVDDAPHQFVIGNFSRPMDYAGFGRERRLTTVKDFGGGVILFRKD
ncbi:MAG TPA: hypothetical protein VL285_02015 [Bryobacteraceae bacterium]|jgi:hypothetical protein|nr:hypothetical protein [Bryobacteraceae bacterium]